jgi:hypothetical protein
MLILNERFLKIFSILVSMFFCYMAFGCAFATGLRQDVPITTNVPDVSIFIDGRPFGATTANGPPLIANLKKSKQHYVTASKEGYQSTTRSLNPTLSSLGILDLVGAAIILIPVITLITGHAYELEPDALYLPLDPLTLEKPQ